MKITNVTETDLENALSEVNKRFDDNITWNRFEQSGNGFNITLKCKSSKKPGHRLGFKGQRMISACWHVHGTFFDCLWANPASANAIIRAGSLVMKSSGDNWQDRNIGSIVQPLYFSEACECNS